MAKGAAVSECRRFNIAGIERAVCYIWNQHRCNWTSVHQRKLIWWCDASAVAFFFWDYILYLVDECVNKTKYETALKWVSRVCNTKKSAYPRDTHAQQKNAKKALEWTVLAMVEHWHTHTHTHTHCRRVSVLCALLLCSSHRNAY